MANITARRELKNARMYLVPAGTVLATGDGSNSLTVAEGAVFPDNSPTTNYTDYEIPDIEELTEELSRKDEKFMVPDQINGAYFEDEEITVVGRKYKGTSHKITAAMKGLAFGLAAKPVIGTAAAINANKDPYVDGVCLIEIANKGGTVIDRAVFWGRFRLTDPGKVGPETSKLGFEVAVRPHVSNSYLCVA